MTIALAERTSSDVNRNGLMPDALALLADLESPAYLFCLDRGWWREVRWDFPHIYFAVGAAARVGAPEEFLFQFECSHYPGHPTLCLQWDATTGAAAPRGLRPKGNGRVGIVFRTDWGDGRYLYTALDRHVLTDHIDWPARFPRSIWRPTSTITRYLTELHGLLNSPDYTGVVGS